MRCTCRHTRRQHRHYRRGSDCSACRCARFRWRWLPLALAAVALVVAGCSAAPAARPAPSPATATTPRPDPLPSCAWYTPTSDTGQLVVVAVTGPACTTHALIAWIADKTDRPWASTRLLIGTNPGTEFARAVKGGSTLLIFEDGTALATQATGGYLADDLSAAGWSVEPPLTPPPTS